MSLLDIWQSLDSTVQGIIIALGVVLLGTIKIKPLEINIWQWLAKTIGNALNKDLISKVDSIEIEQRILEKQFETHVNENKKRDALECRRVILKFANEILRGEKHTKEQYINVLEDIQSYECFCKEHEQDFPNERATHAINLIRDNYRERLEKADFLIEKYRNSELLN